MPFEVPGEFFSRENVLRAYKAICKYAKRPSILPKHNLLVAVNFLKICSESTLCRDEISCDDVTLCGDVTCYFLFVVDNGSYDVVIKCFKIFG